MLRRLMPACWLQDNVDDDVPASETTEAAPKKSYGRYGSNKSKKSSTRSAHKRSTVNGNKLSVDMHEETSATSNELDPEFASMVNEVEIIHLTDRQKDILRNTWTTIYAELGQTLCYVGDPDSSGNDRGVAETFLRLFEEYPMSQQFFGRFRGTPIESLRTDVRLSGALTEHAVRVLRVVEKVIGRIENLEKSKNYLLKLGRFHRHAGIPSDYLGVMGVIFLHAVRPYLEKHNQWDEETEDAWMELFGHVTRVMTHAHVFYLPNAASTSSSNTATIDETTQELHSTTTLACSQ